MTLQMQLQQTDNQVTLQYNSPEKIFTGGWILVLGACILAIVVLLGKIHNSVLPIVMATGCMIGGSIVIISAYRQFTVITRNGTVVVTKKKIYW